MIRMTFQSGLKEKEKQFVAFKQQFGHTYEARIYNLLDFDRFCAANYPGRDTLDRDIVLKWAVLIFFQRQRCGSSWAILIRWKDTASQQ